MNLENDKLSESCIKERMDRGRSEKAIANIIDIIEVFTRSILYDELKPLKKTLKKTRGNGGD
jgi:hypothetical protein